MLNVERLVLCKKACPVEPVSYTHLDVYKRQLGIHHLGADNSQVAVRHFQNLSIANQYGAILQPSLRGKDLAIYYLCQHKSKQFIRSFH